MEPQSLEHSGRCEDWIRRDEGYLPRRFSRTVVMLHPGATATGNREVPFAAPNPNNVRCDEEVELAFDAALLDVFPESTPCRYALYGGFARYPERRRLEELGLLRISGRLDYFVGKGPLGSHVFAATDELFGGFLPLAFLWAEDESWFVASPPDLDFTAVGCTDQLATRLLDDDALHAFEWSG